MPKKTRNRFIARIAELSPPVVRERVIPVVENHVLPVLSHVPGPLIKGLAVWVLLQVMLSESSTVQAAWERLKYHAPRPVHSAVAAVGTTSVGSAVWSASLAVRSTSSRVFHPLRSVHAKQEQRGTDAAEGLMQIQKAIDGIVDAPANAPTTLDDVMKELESTKPATPRR